MNGCLNIVKHLLVNTNLNVNINAKDDNSWTGFNLACREGHSNVARFLTEKSVVLGIDLNVKGFGNTTAFMLACNRGHLDIVKLMIEYRFDILGIDFDDQLLMRDAVRACVIECTWKLKTQLRIQRFFSNGAMLRNYKAHILSFLEYRTAGITHAATTWTMYGLACCNI